jgi:hypothetical protein
VAPPFKYSDSGFFKSGPDFKKSGPDFKKPGPDFIKSGPESLKKGATQKRGQLKKGGKFWHPFYWIL